MVSEINRFIQFNDETVDTQTLLLLERLSRALARTTDIELTERKLMEFNPKEAIFSMSVFWRHRTPEVMHAGRLSDIYLLSAGFWRHFDLPIWQQFSQQFHHHHLHHFALELLLLFEEFRLMEEIEKERPGTAQAFRIRKEVYTHSHTVGCQSNFQLGLLADSLLQECYLSLHSSMLTDSIVKIDGLSMDFLRSILQKVFDATSTKDNAAIVEWVIDVVEDFIPKDLTHQYYSVAHAMIEKGSHFSYHDGVKNATSTKVEEQQTIEEEFRTWHEANKSEEGVHLQYELEHGQSSTLSSADVTAGQEDAEVQTVGHGQSKADMKEVLEADEEHEQRRSITTKQVAKEQYGKEHIYVTFEEKRVEIERTNERIHQLTSWREEHRPFVRTFVQEMKKRIEQKQIDRRDHLLLGRLSKKLTTLLIDERPKPFYKKNAPAVALDAVFGLLVDGSASMMDKLDETKKAVLLFHDVLRELQVKHQISLYYEDSFQASETKQPNYFEHMHTFGDANRDNGARIVSFDAHEDNRDGFAIRWMTDRLRAQPEKHKFLLVFSDGEPSAFGYDQNGILDTAKAVMEAEKQGITVIHLLLSNTEPSADQKQLFSAMYGNKTAAAGSVDSFADQTLRILRKLFAIVVK